MTMWTGDNPDAMRDWWPKAKAGALHAGMFWAIALPVILALHAVDSVWTGSGIGIASGHIAWLYTERWRLSRDRKRGSA